MIAAVVLVAALVACVAHVVEQRARRTPISEQLASVVREARHEDRRVVFRAPASLHGARRSEVLVLRDDRPSGDKAADWRGRFTVARSDELRIYDVVDGRLRETFRFLVRGAGRTRRSPRGGHPRFHVGIESRTGEAVGTSELVTVAAGPLPVPVQVAWDRAARRYRPSPRAQTIETRARRDGYVTPPVFAGRSGSRSVNGYAVDTYKIVRHHPFAALLGGYPDGEALLAGREQYEVELWTEDRRGGAVKSAACSRSSAASSGRSRDGVAALARWLVRHAPARCEP